MVIEDKDGTLREMTADEIADADKEIDAIIWAKVVGAFV